MTQPKKLTKMERFFGVKNKEHHAHNGGVIKKYYNKIWNFTLTAMVYTMILGNAGSAIDRHLAANTVDAKSDMQIQQLAPEKAAILLGSLSATGRSSSLINKHLHHFARRSINQLSALATGYDEQRARLYVNTGLDQKFLDYYADSRENWHN